MSYTEHTWTTGETITAAKMNNIEEGITEAAQSGGGYDLVIRFLDTANNPDCSEWSIADASVISGSIEACETKLTNGELINALCIFRFNYGDNDPDRAMVDVYYRSVVFCNHYREIIFSGGGLYGYPFDAVLIIRYESDYTLDSYEWSGPYWYFD